MKSKLTLSEKKKSFCKDCLLDSESCDKNPIKCMKKEDAKFYFELYAKQFHKLRKGSV